MPPDPLVLACFACLCVTVHIPASSTSTMMTHLAVPPFKYTPANDHRLGILLRPVAIHTGPYNF